MKHEWHSFSTEVTETGGSKAMCGYEIVGGEDGGATTSIGKVDCMACLKAEIKWLNANMDRIRQITEGK